MTPESIPGLSLRDGLELVLWPQLWQLDLTVEELIAELELRGPRPRQPAPAAVDAEGEA